MKNKLLLIGAVGFMTIISVRVFSQTVSPANTPAPKHPMYVPSQATAGKKGGQTITPLKTTQTVHAPLSTQPAPKHPIYGPGQSTTNGKGQAIKPVVQSAHAPLVAQPAPKHPMYTPSSVKPASAAKVTGTNSSPVKQ